MDAFHLELKVRHKGTVHKVSFHDDQFGYADSTNRIIRERIRHAADSVARAFPDPQSPYSDELFKRGVHAAQGIVNAPKKIPARGDWDDPRDSDRTDGR